MKLFKILSVGVLVFVASFLLAQKEIPKQFSPPRLVSDYAELLDAREEKRLSQKLLAYNDSTSTQIAVVIENTLGGDDIIDYCQRIAEGWGIGQAGKDNGILIYVAVADRKLRIHTGYGVEGFLPDAMANRIIEGVLVPAFRKGNYYDGFSRSVDIISDLSNGEYTADEALSGNGEGIPAEAIIFIIIFIIVLFIIINNSDSGGGYHRGGRYERDRGGGWVIIGGPGGGGWNGGGGGGGFSGGGFGGFGGGGFGGGGASGGW